MLHSISYLVGAVLVADGIFHVTYGHYLNGVGMIFLGWGSFGLTFLDVWLSKKGVRRG